MIKEDLIKKFPKPQFSKFPDNKINELIDLCLDTANLYVLTTSGWVILGG